VPKHHESSMTEGFNRLFCIFNARITVETLLTSSQRHRAKRGRAQNGKEAELCLQLRVKFINYKCKVFGDTF